MKIILLTPDQHWFDPIADAFEHNPFLPELIRTQYPSEALLAVPNNEPSIIICESYSLAESNKQPTTKTEQVEEFAVKVKEKNIQSKIIIFAFDLFEIKESLFDVVIVSAAKGSYDILINEVEDYLRSLGEKTTPCYHPLHLRRVTHRQTYCENCGKVFSKTFSGR